MYECAAAGKSTFLSLLAGSLSPTVGSVDRANGRLRVGRYRPHRTPRAARRAPRTALYQLPTTYNLQPTTYYILRPTRYAQHLVDALPSSPSAVEYLHEVAELQLQRGSPAYQQARHPKPSPNPNPYPRASRRATLSLTLTPTPISTLSLSIDRVPAGAPRARHRRTVAACTQAMCAAV